MFKNVNGVQLSVENLKFETNIFEPEISEFSSPKEAKSNGPSSFRYFKRFKAYILKSDEWVQFDAMSENGTSCGIEVIDNRKVAPWISFMGGFPEPGPDYVFQYLSVNNHFNSVYTGLDKMKYVEIDSTIIPLKMPPDTQCAYGFVITNENRIFGQIYGKQQQAFAEWDKYGDYRLVGITGDLKMSPFYENGKIGENQMSCILEEAATGVLVPCVVDFDNNTVRRIPLQPLNKFGKNFIGNSNGLDGVILSSTFVKTGDPVGLYYWENGSPQSTRININTDKIFVTDAHKDDAFIGAIPGENDESNGHYYDNGRFFDTSIDFLEDLSSSYWDMKWCNGSFISRNNLVVGHCYFGGSDPHRSFFFGELDL